MGASGQLPSSLAWKQPSAVHRRFDLVSGDRAYGTLQFVRPLRYLAEASVNGDTFSFEVNGLLHRRIMVKKAPFEQEIGVLDLDGAGKGILEMSGGHRYYLDRIEGTDDSWEVLDPEKRAMAELRGHERFPRLEAVVTIYDKRSNEAALGLLLALCWYMILVGVYDSLRGTVVGEAITGWW